MGSVYKPRVGKVRPLNKEVLEQYIDACELIKETEADIRRVKSNARP